MSSYKNTAFLTDTQDNLQMDTSSSSGRSSADSLPDKNLDFVIKVAGKIYWEIYSSKRPTRASAFARCICVDCLCSKNNSQDSF